MKHLESPSAMPSGIRLGIACAAMTVVAFGAAAFTDHGSAQRLLVMAVAVGLVAALIPVRLYAVAAAVIGYLIYIGFMVNEFGELNWHERSPSGDLVRFGLAFCLGRGQLWIRKGLATLPQEPAPAAAVSEIMTPSRRRHDSAAERMDAVKSSPAREPHRVSF